ncbi:MAG: nucleotidyl transferase AbiEii/AbiGii toxin family protein [Melioribacteraceae bacterium]
MRLVIKKLNAEEIEFYENRLYPLQDAVLGLLDQERFYLTGGTCLSRFYFNHRYSEDLDFFCDGTLYSAGQFEIDYLTTV